MNQRARRITKVIAALAVGVSAAALPLLAQAQEEDDATYSASTPMRVNTAEPKYAAIVVDARTGEVLYAKRADSPRYPASITKIMTMYLAFEQLASGKMKPTDLITVSAHASAQSPTKLGLRPGEQITVEDALHAIAVKSANDMAVAMAEHIGGSESRFAAMMTLRAHELGMTNSHFVNASGLPDSRQISTARDIAVLSRSVMRDYPQYYSFFSQETFVFRGRSMNNHNGLLGKMPGVDGLKTGFINASGFNLAASAVRDNRRLIAVVLGGNTTAGRDAHVEDLLDTGFLVEQRRAMGQRVDFASNLAEPAPIGAITRPPTEEGGADQGGVHIVLTDNDGVRAPIGAAPQVRAVVPDQPARAVRADRGARMIPVKADADDRAAKKDRRGRSDGAWAVQVGAYKGKSMAHAQVAQISHKYSKHLGDAKGGVEAADHGYYRARFSGLSAQDAKDACRALRAHDETCMVLPPTG